MCLRIIKVYESISCSFEVNPLEDYTVATSVWRFALPEFYFSVVTWIKAAKNVYLISGAKVIWWINTSVLFYTVRFLLLVYDILLRMEQRT